MALGRILAAVVGLVGVRMLTGVLEVRAFGELALGLSAAMLFQNISFNPTAESAARYLMPAARSGNLDGYLRAVSRRVLRSGVLAVLAGLLMFFGAWLFGRATLGSLALASMVYAAVSGSERVLQFIHESARRRIVVGGHQVFSMVARYGFAVSLVTIVGRGSTSAMAGFAAGIFLSLVSQLVVMERTLKRLATEATDETIDEVFDDASWRRRLSAFGRPLAIWGAFEWAHFGSDRWLLGLFGSTTAVGLYTVLFQITWYPVALGLEALIQFARPSIFSNSAFGTDLVGLRRAKRLVDMLVLGTVAATACFTLVSLPFGHVMVSILAAPAYREVSGPLPLMLLASGLFAASRAAGVGLGALEETKRLIAPRVACSVLSVGFTALGAWRYGITGVVWANVCFAVLLLTWTYVLMRQSYARRFGDSEDRIDVSGGVNEGWAGQHS